MPRIESEFLTSPILLFHGLLESILMVCNIPVEYFLDMILEDDVVYELTDFLGQISQSTESCVTLSIQSFSSYEPAPPSLSLLECTVCSLAFLPGESMAETSRQLRTIFEGKRDLEFIHSCVLGGVRITACYGASSLINIP